MIPFTNSYRSQGIFFVVLLTANFACAQTAKSLATTPPDPTAKMAVQQTQSLAGMTAALDKQKISLNAQLAIPAPTDSFFTTAWTTPATIPIPHLIASCSPLAEAELAPIIAENAKKQELKPELIRAVIKRESAAYPCAVSERGALGLMQLMPDVAEQFGVDPLDAAANVQAGSKYLKQLMTRYKGEMKLALAAYNAGPQRVDADKKVPDIPETVAYVESILKDLTQSAASRH
jgi:soluble lytic murein transglycosylase-like protein